MRETVEQRTEQGIDQRIQKAQAEQQQAAEATFS